MSNVPGNSEKPPIGVIGAGWVGLVTACCFAELGHEVVVREIVQEKVDVLSRGELIMHEPGLPELLKKNIGHMTFTTDMGEVLDRTRLMFVCVDTPPTYSGDADLSRVQQVVREVGDSNDHALIMKSTVPVGTGTAIRRDKHDLAYVSCPEFLKEGTAVDDFMHPDRVVVGADNGDWAGDAVEELYRPLGGEMVRTDIASAEMIKLASNAFLATKISFINEIANVSEEVGADVTEVARGMGLDTRIGPKFLQAGIGYGGSCFPKDVTALKQLAGNSGYHFQLLNAVIEVNELQKRRVIGKLKKHLGDSLVGKKIALLGLSFKPNTDDMREASSLVLSARLRGEGAIVSAFDPVASERAAELLPGVEIEETPLAALDGADAAVIVTEWPEFAEIDLAQLRATMRTPLIIDGRNLLDGSAVAAAGFAYEGVGRPSVGSLDTGTDNSLQAPAVASATAE
jgi:UDPglucose 6-dehydrogenase